MFKFYVVDIVPGVQFIDWSWPTMEPKNVFIKFIWEDYKKYKNLTIYLMLLGTLVKKRRNIFFQIFIAFLEYLNFIHLHFHETVSMLAISIGRVTRENEEFFKKNSNANLYIFWTHCVTWFLDRELGIKMFYYLGSYFWCFLF